MNSGYYHVQGTSIYIHGLKRASYGYYTVSVDNKILRQFDASQASFGTITYQNDLEDTLHEVVLTNPGRPNGRTIIDVDYVIWTSARDTLVVATILDDTDRNWTCTGTGKVRRGVSDSTRLVRTFASHGSFTFEGVTMYLHGHLWEDHGWPND